MKKIITTTLVLALLAGSQLKAQEKAALAKSEKAAIEWITLEQAQEKMKTAPRKILLDIYTPWCGPCKMMSSQTFKDPAVVELVNKKYYAVKFNGEGGHDVTFNGKTYTNPGFDQARGERSRNSMHSFTSAMRVTGYPTVFVIDEKLNVDNQYPGFRTARQILPILQKAVK